MHQAKKQGKKRGKKVAGLKKTEGLSPNDSRFNELVANGEIERPPPGTKLSCEPVVDVPIEGILQRFLEDRR